MCEAVAGVHLITNMSHHSGPSKRKEPVIHRCVCRLCRFLLVEREREREDGNKEKHIHAVYNMHRKHDTVKGLSEAYVGGGS